MLSMHCNSERLTRHHCLRSAYLLAAAAGCCRRCHAHTPQPVPLSRHERLLAGHLCWGAAALQAAARRVIAAGAAAAHGTSVSRALRKLQSAAQSLCYLRCVMKTVMCSR